jgi:CubicO group peptidase (beta-lactamase class C family)
MIQIMKKIFIMILAVSFTCSSFGQSAQNKLDELINAYATLNQFNGSALVVMKGTVLLDKGYGYRNAGDKIMNDKNSIFQLGSITKQFTSAVILKLLQEKRLSLTDKLSKYFPEYPKGDSITIQQLLTHTSGIYNYTNDADFMKNEITVPATREKMMALFENKPLDFSPGTSWNYSNSGYLMLGYIIQEVTKMPYYEAVRKYVFIPLHMTQSGFDFTHLKDNNKTTGYFKLNGAESLPAPIVDSTVSFSAGSIYSTTGDLYLWHQALENDKVLSKTQQEAAYTPLKNNYGYGWVIDSLYGKRRVSHNGGIPGYITTLVRIPEDDVFIILLSNASNESLTEMDNNILAILYGKEYTVPKERTAVVLPLETLKQYEGEYEMRPGLNVVLNVKDGALQATPTGQSPKLFKAEKEDLFFEKEDNIQIEFIRNEKKEVDGFMLHQGGQEIKCKKIK